jgi:glyoxylate/hydroxypyruvate reductase A
MSTLMLARRVPELLAVHQARRFQKLRGLRFEELHVAVLGYGPIGQVTARCLVDLGATVEVIRRTPEPEAVPVQYPTDQLARVLARSHGLVVACALTRETRNLLDRQMLEALPWGGFFVNVARGGVVDHQALADLLADGHLSGAVLDTTDPEPLPADHPLWESPGCLITSHTAAHAGDFLSDAVDLFCANLRRFIADEPLLHVVDRARGY